MPGFVCILNVPAQAAGASVETKQVRVIRFDVDRLSPNRDTAAFVCRRVIQQAGAHRALVMPQHAPGSGIKSKAIVGRSDIHDSANDHRSRFQHLGITGMKNPSSTQPVDFGGGDLIQITETTSGVVAVVGRPVFADRLRQ